MLGIIKPIGLIACVIFFGEGPGVGAYQRSSAKCSYTPSDYVTTHLSQE